MCSSSFSYEQWAWFGGCVEILGPALLVSPDTPALLTRMCSAFSSLRILSANARTESILERSTRRRCTSKFPVFSLISLSAAVPLASLRQAKITRAPRRAKSRAMNFPIPSRVEQNKTLLVEICLNNRLIKRQIYIRSKT